MAAIYAIHLDSGKMVTFTVAGVSAMYRDLPTDTLLVAVGTTAKALFADDEARLEAVWERRITFSEAETFAWLEVESDFLDADEETAVTATVEIFDADENLLSTTTVSSREPERLAPFEEDEIIVRVTSKAQITAVKLAGSTEELQQL